MIHLNRHPVGRDMAILTTVPTGNMHERLADGRRVVAIMTTNTDIRQGSMIDIGRGPPTGGMTVCTIFTALNVGQGPAGNHDIIMA